MQARILVLPLMLLGMPLAPACSSDPYGDATTPACKCGEPNCPCVVVPKEWTLVGITTSAGAGEGELPKTPTGCPAYWNEPRMLVEGVKSKADECTCTCEVAAGCSGGDLKLALRKNGHVCGDDQASVRVNGECQPLSFAWSRDYDGVNAAVPRDSTPCEPKGVRPPVVYERSASICTSPVPSPCAEGACVQVPSSVTPCLLSRSRDATCPTGWPNRRAMAESSYVTDDRRCEACACKPLTCSGKGKLSFYSNGDCTQGERSASIDASCNGFTPPAGTDFDAKSMRFVSNTQGTCEPTQRTVELTGGMTIPPVATNTLCCR